MKTMKNRVSALFVALVMMLSLLSVGAVAWSGGEGIDVYWNDEKVGTVTYDAINEKLNSVSEDTYSSHKDGVYKPYTGKVYHLNKFLGKVNKAEDWTSAPAETTFELYDPNYPDKGAKLTKAELEETRNSYDKDGNLIKEGVKPGFMLSSGNEYFQFVYGQKAVGENTNGNFAKFTSDKNAVLKINTSVTPDPSEDEEQGDGIDVYWNDNKVGSVSYGQMIDDVSHATSTVKYSAVTGKGIRTEDIEGYVYKFSQLMKAVNKEKDWDKASSKSIVEIAYGNDKKEYTKSDLDDLRYYFDSEGNKVNRVSAGFMDLDHASADRQFQLVFGQSSPDDKNKPKFYTLKRNVITKISIQTPELAIVDEDGNSKELFFTDLQKLWEQEGSVKYNYTSINTHPRFFPPEEYYGPTLKTVLAEANIDLDELSDTDIIRFESTDGRYGDITVKNINATRYAFPNGESKNQFTGTTDAQLKDKVEVPFIISVANTKTNIRDVFGQIDPQEQNHSYYVKSLCKISLLKNAATDYKDWSPTIPDGGKYYEGAKLNFDLVLPEGVYEGFVYYTSSTDGTEPADPSHSDILYNFAQNDAKEPKAYENPEKASHFNSYVFTNAEKTIIKVKTYIFGCTEPQATTLTYTLCTDHVAAEPVKENEKEATCTEEGSYDEVVYCSECHKELSRTTKTVDKLPHTFENGKCTVCGATDPDYKPEPKFTGLANEADKDGVWWYYTDGKIDKNHTGVDQNKYGWWRVENGKVNFKAQGIYQNQYGWWKTTDGKVTFKENSIYQNQYGWWKCKDSKVDFTAQSIYQNKHGWWKTTDGKVTFKENGLFKNQYGTWKVENSKVNFNFNGKYQGKTIKNGKVV